LSSDSAVEFLTYRLPNNNYGFAYQINEMAADCRQRSLTSDHATAELTCLKSQLHQTNCQLSDAQQVLAGKVSNKTPSELVSMS